MNGARTLLRARNYRREMMAQRAEAGSIVLSYPKCGRTWHRILLGRYLSGLLQADPAASMDVEALSARSGANRVHYSHNGSSPTERIPASHALVGSPLGWSERDVIVLVRDPRDAMVSMYYHMQYRERGFNGPISEFIRSSDMGVAKLTSAWKRWSENRHLATSFVVQSYEQMHRDPKHVLRETLNWLGLKTIDEKLVHEAVEFASFGNLRGLESSNYFNYEALNNETGDPRAAKVREGKVGGYESELSEEDIGFIENAVREIGDPFGTLKPHTA